MWTFAEELWHAANTDPVLDADRHFPEGLSDDDLAELFRSSRTPRRRKPVDGDGNDVRVFERDDEEGIRVLLQLNTEKEVWSGPVWQDIVTVRHDHPSQTEQRARWLAMSDEEKFRYHIHQKCPNPQLTCIWVGYRDDEPTYAYLLERLRSKPDEVWIQWLVGTDAMKHRPVPLLRALWDIGVRRIGWKSLARHPLMEGRWQRIPTIKTRPSEIWERHHPGHYVVASFDMVERPDPATKWWEPR